MPDYRRVKIQGGTYFFTIVTHQRKQLFLHAKAPDLFLESLNHVNKFHPFSSLAYCILPDHIHLLWKMPVNDAEYSTRISEIKKKFSKYFIAEYGTSNFINQSQKNRGETGIWQRRFWEHYIRDEEDLERHINYIHYNPVKHGLVDQVNEWSASSFFDYVEQGYYTYDWGQGGLQKTDSHSFGE
jgi:putative transposase